MKTFKIYQAALFVKVLLMHNERFPHMKPNVLKSFGVLDREMSDLVDKHRDKIGSLILDSGTWTLNMSVPLAKKKRITLENYKNYVEEFGSEVDFYFNFDEDFTEQGFERNLYCQSILEAKGLKPVPVIHDIYSDEEIDYYIEEHIKHNKYPLIALGSAQIKSVDQLTHVIRRFNGTGIDLHLFGHTKFDLIANFPLASCDSAAWARTAAYGYIHYWNPQKEGENKRDAIYMEEYLNPDKKVKVTWSNYEYRGELEKYLKETLGITEDDLLGWEGTKYKMLTNLHYYMTLEEEVNKIRCQNEGVTEGV